MRLLISVLTGLGIVLFFLVSIFWLEELILKFLAAILLSMLVFYLFYFLFTAWSLRRKPVEIINITHPHLYPGEKAELELTGENLILPFSGTYTVLRFDMHENHEAVEKNVTCHINSISKNSLVFSYVPQRHGLFTLKNFRVIIRDLFGFIEYSAKVSFEHNFQVFPGYLHEVKIPFFMDKGGDRIVHSVIKEKSTDFFENRKYFPGDDTRKINWKIFAHSDELHIREVEQIPPKMGEISLIFAPYSSNIEEYEHISSLFFTTAAHLIQYGITLHILSPAQTGPVIIDINGEQQFTRLMNNSYRPFPNIPELQGSQNPVFFLSFEEALRFRELGRLSDKNYLILSYNNLETPNSRLIRALFSIDSHDSLFADIGFLTERKRNFNKRRQQIELLHSLFAAAPDNLQIYETKSSNYEQKK